MQATRTETKLTIALFLLPALLLVGVFVYAFIGWTVGISLTDWSGLARQYQLQGLQNYVELLRDFRFQTDIVNNLVLLVFFVGLTTPLGLMLAVFLEQGIRYESFFRTSFLFPMALSFVVTGTIWAWLYNPQQGLNSIFRALGLSWDPLWIAHPDEAMPSVIIAAIWQFAGFAMAVFLGGLRAIPDELKEAAAIDGASPLQTYRFVIMPLLGPTLFSVVVMLTHIVLKTFDLIWVMTFGGPGYSTDMPGVYMFIATFRQDRIAYGAAIAVYMFLMVMAIIIPYIVYSRRKGDLQL